MPKQPKICQRKRDGIYYVAVDGKQVPLGRDLEKARQQYHREMLKRRPRGSIVEPDLFLSNLIDRFLSWVEINRDVRTHEWYSRFLSAADYNLKAFIDIDPKALTVDHVERWLRQVPEGSRPQAFRALQRLQNWAVWQGLLESNPVKRAERPAKAAPQKLYVPPEKWAEFVKKLKSPLLEAVLFMRWTGCRPQEMRAVEARHFEKNVIVFPVLESKGKRYKRVIPLPDPALALIVKLVARHPVGRLFRNSKNAAWTANALNWAFDRVDKSICPKAVRRTFITDALIAGMPPAVLAEIVGHRDLTMIMTIYSELQDQRDVLRQQMNKFMSPGTLQYPQAGHGLDSVDV